MDFQLRRGNFRQTLVEEHPPQRGRKRALDLRMRTLKKRIRKGLDVPDELWSQERDNSGSRPFGQQGSGDEPEGNESVERSARRGALP